MLASIKSMLSSRVFPTGGIFTLHSGEVVPDPVCNYIFLVRSGLVIAERSVGKNRQDRLYFPGDIFGFQKMSDLQPLVGRRERLIARGDVQVEFWTTHELQEFVDRYQVNSFELLQLLADTIEDEIVWATFRSGRALHRLVNLFLALNDRYGLQGIMPSITHKDWASIVGITRENVPSQLNKLEKGGLVESKRVGHRSQLHLSDVPGLKILVGKTRESTRK